MKYYIKVTGNTLSGFWNDEKSLIVSTLEEATQWDNYQRVDILCGSLKYFYHDYFFQRKLVMET